MPGSTHSPTLLLASRRSSVRRPGTGDSAEGSRVQTHSQIQVTHLALRTLRIVLWELSEPNAEVAKDLIQTALRIVLDRESHAYTMLCESLTANQCRFLRGLALESRGVKPFLSAFTKRYGLRSASNGCDAPYPCGSGKKFKKCCLKRSSVK